MKIVFTKKVVACIFSHSTFYLVARMAQSSSTPILELTPAGFDEYNAQLQTAALQATRHAVSLPSTSDLSLHRSLDRTFGKELDACSERVLSLTNKLLSVIASGSAQGKGKGRKLENEDDVLDQFHTVVVDRMDELFERAVRNALWGLLSLSLGD